MYLTCWVCNNFDICPNNMGLIMCFLLSFSCIILQTGGQVRYVSHNILALFMLYIGSKVNITNVFLGTFLLWYPRLEIEDPRFWPPKLEMKAMELWRKN